MILKFNIYDHDNDTGDNVVAAIVIVTVVVIRL